MLSSRNYPSSLCTFLLFKNLDFRSWNWTKYSLLKVKCCENVTVWKTPIKIKVILLIFLICLLGKRENEVRETKEFNNEVYRMKSSFEKPDVALIVEGEKLFTHKTVLSKKSPVFSALFTSDFKEKDQFEVNLPNKSLHHLLMFLSFKGKFMYSTYINTLNKRYKAITITIIVKHITDSWGNLVFGIKN